MKDRSYKDKQSFTQKRKKSLKRYNREKVIKKYQIEINNGKTDKTKVHDYTIITNLTMNIDKPFIKITQDDLLDYFSKMEQGIILNYHAKKYSSHTIEQHKVQICKFFKWLHNWEKWKPLTEPFRRININLSKAYKFKNLSDIPSKEDIENLIKTCDKSKNLFLIIRDKALIGTFYDSGGRLEEISKLKIKDIIRQDNNFLIALDGKNGRRIVCLNRFSRFLKEYLSIHPNNTDSNSPLWLNQYGEKLKYVSIRGRFVSIHQKSGLKHFSPHDIRHRRATDLVEMGFSEAEQRHIMGWSTTSKTPAKYTHLSGKKLIKN